MSVMSRDAHKRLMTELNNRFINLRDLLASRELINNTEEAGHRKVWRHPENLVALVSSSSEIRLAVADFKSILAEINKL